MKTKVKNGYIELLRFVFALGIIGGHFIGYTEEEVTGLFYHFSNGWIGVEFFLLLTGYFLAVDINNKSKLGAKKSLAECLKKIVSRYFRIMKYYAFALIVIVLLNQIYNGLNAELLKLDAVSAIKNLFMLDMLGVFNISPLFPYNWYLSAMMIAFVIIYPIAYYSNDVIRKVVLPILGFILLLIIFQKTGHITVLYEKMWGVYYGTWRAIAEILIGMGILSIVECMDRVWKNGLAGIRCILELAGIGAALIYMNLYTDQSKVVYVIVLIAVSLAFSFSSNAVLPKLFNNKVVGYLGKLSLPMYINQHSGYLLTLISGRTLHNDIPGYICIVIFTVIISAIELLLFEALGSLTIFKDRKTI